MTPKPLKSATKKRKVFWIAVAVLVLAVAGAYGYSSKIFTGSQTQNETQSQTAVIRRGDIVVSASGSGTVIAQTDASFGFATSGQVTDVYVKVGDRVEAGQVLAQLDNTLAQMDYVEAGQALEELYSAASIATVQQEIGTAQDTEFYAREWLEYLISPEVVEAEENLAIAEQKLAAAQAEARTNPSDTATQNVKGKEAAVTFLKEKLDQAWAYYNNEYLLKNFAVYETVGRGRHAKQVLATEIDPITGEEVPEINEPSTADIAIARNNLAQARETVRENEVYLEALESGVIPDGATGAKLTTLYETHLAVEEAKDALEATQLIAPISGTVTALDLNVGEQVDKDSSSIITISQLSQPYALDVYLDEADWSMAQIGNKVNVTFDLLPEQTFPGTVTLVYPELTESFEASLMHLAVQLDQRITQELPAGTGASVDVIGGEANRVVLVSVSAIHEREDGKYAVTVIQNRKQVEREVEIGLQNETYAEVKSGLEAGEIVMSE